jgi:hypothetical protein
MLSVHAPLLLPLFLPMLCAPTPLFRTPVIAFALLPPRPTTPSAQGEAMGLDAEALQPRLLLRLGRPDADDIGGRTRI